MTTTADSDDDSSCKGAHAWVHVGGDSPVPDIRCEKCKTTPAEAAGLSGTHDMHAAPVPDLLESPPMASTKSSPTPASASAATGESMTPVPAHREPDGALNDPMEADMNASDGDHETPTRLEAGMMKSSPEVAAVLRFKSAGISTELGRLHDLTCPAYHPEDVAKCHPFADFRSHRRGVLPAGSRQGRLRPVDGPRQEPAPGVAGGAGTEGSRPGAAERLPARGPQGVPRRQPRPGLSADTGRDRRPASTTGPSSPTGTRHHLRRTTGRTRAPPWPRRAPNAHSFDRPPLAAGHQSPSPSHMKSGLGEYPSEQGRPTQINYAVMEKERARHALMQMHEHLSRQFPEACPMDLNAPVAQPESRGVPPTAGIGKSIDPEPAAAAPAPVAAVIKAPAEDEYMDEAVYKGFKKMRKKLGKKVLAGKMTVDEARAKMGRQFAQKATEPAEAVQKRLASRSPKASRRSRAPPSRNSSSPPSPKPGPPGIRHRSEAATVYGLRPVACHRGRRHQGGRPAPGEDPGAGKHQAR